MKVKLLNIDSSKSETIDISDKILKLKVNHKLIKSVVDWQLNHLKPRTAKTKQKMRLLDQLKKSSHKKVAVELDMLVEKHQFLLVEVSLMVLKVLFIK